MTIQEIILQLQRPRPTSFILQLASAHFRSTVRGSTVNGQPNKGPASLRALDLRHVQSLIDSQYWRLAPVSRLRAHATSQSASVHLRQPIDNGTDCMHGLRRQSSYCSCLEFSIPYPTDKVFSAIDCIHHDEHNGVSRHFVLAFDGRQKDDQPTSSTRSLNRTPPL